MQNLPITMRKAFTIAAATLALLWLTLPQAMAQAPVKSSGTVMHSGAIVASPQLSPVHSVDMNSPEARLKMESGKNMSQDEASLKERAAVLEKIHAEQPPRYIDTGNYDADMAAFNKWKDEYNSKHGITEPTKDIIK
jgi:hypothetical protein